MTEVQTKTEIKLTEADDPRLLFGTHDKHLKLIEESFPVTIRTRGEMIQFQGSKEAVDQTVDLFSVLRELIKRGVALATPDIVTAIQMEKSGDINRLLEMYEEEILKDYNGKPIRPKTLGQKRYIDQIRAHDVTFGVGPAGTGKTFLAVVLAIAALKKGQVKKIILTRPAIEAGENLGFLPGDLKEKVDPYLRPVYDALYQIFGVEHTNRLMDRGVIEIAPLAYMRGRTLEDAFVILDEAQNTTVAQMKMFLTRLGYQSKMIVNGDISQIDLPRGASSGLIHAKHILKDIPAIALVSFDASDVVRHPVVAKIISAYDQAEIKNQSSSK